MIKDRRISRTIWIVTGMMIAFSSGMSFGQSQLLVTVHWNPWSILAIAAALFLQIRDVWKRDS